MNATAYPSPDLSHRRVDLAVHIIGLVLIPTRVAFSFQKQSTAKKTGWLLPSYYICFALASDLASCTYHFSPGLTGLAIWNKITNEMVKSRWSTISYLGLGAIGLSALPDLTAVPVKALWCIISGAVCYVIGTAFYVRETIPFRYAIWRSRISFGGILMFVDVWIAMF